jgi:hypothetical protein
VQREGEQIEVTAGAQGPLQRQGKRYSQKMVEVYYLTEGDAIVVVTVYVFFGTWES